MKKLILLVTAITLFIFGGQATYACTCGIPSRSEIESKSEADFAQWLKSLNGAVFIGRVAKNKRGEITFLVERYWKGPDTRRVVVYTSTSEASCGVSYRVGKKYLVFAYNLRGELRTDLCSHLSATKYKDVYLKKLGTGEQRQG